MLKLTLIALFGALGSLARFFFGKLNHEHSFIPWGTLSANCLGCFLFGLLVSLSDSKGMISPFYKGVVLTGFMGAFTTFSTYSFEIIDAVQKGKALPALTLFMAHNIIGLFSVFLGLKIGAQ